MLVDDELASVGTANFDYRSFRLNFEVNTFIYDLELGKRMAAIYERDLLHCRPFDHDQICRRPFLGHVKEAVSRLVAPLL